MIVTRGEQNCKKSSCIFFFHPLSIFHHHHEIIPSVSVLCFVYFLRVSHIYNIITVSWLLRLIVRFVAYDLLHCVSGFYFFFFFHVCILYMSMMFCYIWRIIIKREIVWNKQKKISQIIVIGHSGYHVVLYICCHFFSPVTGVLLLKLFLCNVSRGSQKVELPSMNTYTLQTLFSLGQS